MKFDYKNSLAMALVIAFISGLVWLVLEWSIFCDKLGFFAPLAFAAPTILILIVGAGFLQTEGDK